MPKELFISFNNGKGVDQTTFKVEKPEERNNPCFIATIVLGPNLLGLSLTKHYAGTGDTEDEAIANCTDQLIDDLQALADYLRA